jgi:hypothetical protein
LNEILDQIVSIRRQIEALNVAWSRLLGVNVHQWKIMSALLNAGDGRGLSVAKVAITVDADPSFMSSQSRINATRRNGPCKVDLVNLFHRQLGVPYTALLSSILSIALSMKRRRWRQSSHPDRATKSDSRGRDSRG